jgi:hypothetical protein
MKLLTQYIRVFVTILLIVQQSYVSLAQCDSFDGTFSVSTNAFNSGVGFTQRYVIVDASNDEILTINATGNFTGLSAGSYEIYAVNYEGVSPAELSVGSSWTDLEAYEAAGTGCIDLSSMYLDRAVTVCDTEEICEPDDIVVSTINHTADPGYSQVFVLVNSIGVILESNSSGTFTLSDYLNDGVFDIYACNTNDAAVLAEISDLGDWQDIPDLEAAGSCVSILGPRVIEVIDENDASCMMALPVEIALFTGNCADGMLSLNWTTMSENNNKGFYIQTSENAIDFVNIDFITGFGNTNFQNHYTWEGESYLPEVYLRLKQIDFNDDYSFSKTLQMSCLNSPSEIDYRIKYNKPEVVVVFSEPLELHSQIELYSSIGQLLYANEIDAGALEFKLPSNLVLSSEIYFLKIYNTSFQKTEKIVLY